MNLFNSIKTQFQRLKSQFAATFKRDVSPVGRRWSVRTDASDARGAVKAVLTIYTDEKIVGPVKEEIGRQGVEAVQKALEPIKRTGKTAESFTYRISDNKIEVYSNAPQAETIQSGINKTTVPGLMEWMQSKPEFSNLTDKEQKSVAFAIRNHMRAGRAPGGKSTIGKLQPTGQRAYNYTEVAQQQMIGKMEAILNAYSI